MLPDDQIDHVYNAADGKRNTPHYVIKRTFLSFTSLRDKFLIKKAMINIMAINMYGAKVKLYTAVLKIFTFRRPKHDVGKKQEGKNRTLKKT